MKEWLIGKNLEELQEVASKIGMPKFAAKQMAQWLYQKRITSIDQMTNISKEMRAKLEEQFEVGGFAAEQIQTSIDGTRKYLFPTIHSREFLQKVALSANELSANEEIKVPDNCRDMEGIETVMIPEADRATICVSSQVGCQMGCRFCMTGRMGFVTNLTAGEIIGQVLRIDESEKLTNIVYMGMGEPLNNLDNVLRSIEILTAPWGLAWSPKRITVSTVGILPKMDRLLTETQVHVAVSLHNPIASERAEIMPAQKAYALDKVLAKLHEYDFHHQRRVSFEYILFGGMNDDYPHAQALVKLLKSVGGNFYTDCRINLIRFHTIPNSPFFSPKDESVKQFQEWLNKAGILATVRASRGEDIMAACGLLSTDANKQNSKSL